MRAHSDRQPEAGWLEANSQRAIGAFLGRPLVGLGERMMEQTRLKMVVEH